MSTMSRREFGVGLAALGGVAAEGQSGATGGSLGTSRVLAPALTRQANGTERWPVLQGTLGTGEAVAMHESVVPAGTPKSTLHRIQHSELVVVVEGTLSFQHEDVVEEAKAGSVIYVAYGTNHLVWNSGEGTARYYVLQMGGDTKKG